MVIWRGRTCAGAGGGGQASWLGWLGWQSQEARQEGHEGQGQGQAEGMRGRMVKGRDLTGQGPARSRPKG